MGSDREGSKECAKSLADRLSSAPEMESAASDPFETYFAELRARHLARASLGDIRKGIQSLSILYVERRARLGGEDPMEGAAKRAAFALFYAPLHFLLVRQIVREIGAGQPVPRLIFDLGCGTGAAGAAWALEAGGAPVEGVDRSSWAVDEARWTLSTLGLKGRVRRLDAERARFPGEGCAILAAFTVNELEAATRDRILAGLLRAAGKGARILVIEPIARSVVPWWNAWSDEFSARGGRADEWRFAVELPGELEELDRSAGLDHSELTARSLWIA